MNDTVEVYLPRQTKPVLLDCQDFCDVWQRYQWGAHKGHIYVRGYLVELGGEILRPIRPLQTDHINRNPFDNRRRNLRVATLNESSRNRGKTKRLCSSRFKGVCWHKQEQKWYASICANGASKSLGLFDDEVSAARAYNEAALRYHGEFAALNDLD